MGGGVLFALSDGSGMSLGWYHGKGSLRQWPTTENEDSSSNSSWCALKLANQNKVGSLNS